MLKTVPVQSGRVSNIWVTRFGLCNITNTTVFITTFCMSRRRREMYCGHTRLCICVCMCLSVCVSAAVRPHYCTDPYVTWGHGRGCPLVVHYWADLQSVHRLRCYRNITRTLVYAGCAPAAGQRPAGVGGCSQNCSPYMGSGPGWLAGNWPSPGGCSQHYCGGLDCGLPMVAFWRHYANAKC